MKSLCLCRYSRKPSAFTQWPPTCASILDENLSETTEHASNTVLCVFWNQSLIVSSISALCTSSVSKKTVESLHTTQPSIKYGDSVLVRHPRTSSVSTGCQGCRCHRCHHSIGNRLCCVVLAPHDTTQPSTNVRRLFLVHHRLQVSRQRAKVAVGNDVISASEIGIAASFLHNFPASLAGSLFNLETSLSLDDCALTQLDPERDFRSFTFKMDAAIFARYWCSPTTMEVFDICGDELVIRSKHQFLDSLMELFN